MALKLYYDALSQPSRAVLMFIRKNAIPCQEVYTHIQKLEHKTDDYAENVNPFQKVPAIVHGQFRLSESVAIMRYLARTFKTPDHWYPTDIHKQAQVDAYVEWQHLNTRTFGTMYFMSRFGWPLIIGKPENPKQTASFEKKLDNVVNQIEQIWLKDRPFVGGHEISIADLLACCELEQSAMAGYDIKNRPILAPYIQRVKDYMNPIYDDAHKRCYHGGKVFRDQGIDAVREAYENLV